MRSQQAADREEQQRIKNLVLNYEAANEPEPTESMSLTYHFNPTPPNRNKAFEKRTSASQRVDKSAANRTAFRSRKLQLSDVNW